MRKFFLYFIVLIAFVPLVSYGKARPRAKKHASETRDITGSSLSNGYEDIDSVKVITAYIPFQDSIIRSGNKKRIKEVAKARPQSRPEKIGKREPVDRPENPGDIRRTNGRPGGNIPPNNGRGGARPGGGQGGPRQQGPSRGR
jgi:hypothetical protein